jgi:hypothetical protein
MTWLSSNAWLYQWGFCFLVPNALSLLSLKAAYLYLGGFICFALIRIGDLLLDNFIRN